MRSRWLTVGRLFAHWGLGGMIGILLGLQISGGDAFLFMFLLMLAGQIIAYICTDSR